MTGSMEARSIGAGHRARVTGDQSRRRRPMTSEFFPHFTEHEYARRHTITRSWMAASDLDCLVIYASAYGPDPVRWLTGFPPRHDTYLVWPRTEPPTLLVQLFNHVPNAQELAQIADVRWGGPDSAQTLAGRLDALRPRRVGLIGRLPYQTYGRLVIHLPDVRWQDMGPAFTTLRLVKSQEEVDWLRQGAAFTDAAMAALQAAALPGASEYELVAAIEAAYTAAGGEHGIHFLSSTPMATPRSYVPRQNQGARRLSVGDVVICELSAGRGGYNGQIHRPVAVGRPPTRAYQRLYEVALAAYQGIVAALRPGNRVTDALDAADAIAAAGLTVCDDLLHGYGAGYLAPVARTRQTAHSGQVDESFTFAANMAIVVQPNVYDPATGAGLQLGNLLLITESGAECLQRQPLAFAVTAV